MTCVICRSKVRELEAALDSAQAEHMDYEFLQLQLQELETTNADQHQVFKFYSGSCTRG